MKIRLELDIADADIARIEHFTGRKATPAEIVRFLREEIGQSIRELRDQHP